MKELTSVNDAKMYPVFFIIFAAIFFSTIFPLSASKLSGDRLTKSGVSKAAAPAGDVPADYWKGHDFFQIQFIHP